jgi:hypothetical protein
VDASVTRFVAVLVKTTYRPSALMTGWVLAALPAAVPNEASAALTSVAAPENGSFDPWMAVDRKMFATPPVETGVRSVAVDTNATFCPSGVTYGSVDAPAFVRETRNVSEPEGSGTAASAGVAAGSAVTIHPTSSAITEPTATVRRAGAGAIIVVSLRSICVGCRVGAG